jgi:ABC-2 type transport system ATP-binding protein
MTPTSGVVTVNGDPVRSRMPEIGYVPQFEITHGRLTVLESLSYSARLRLPQDATDEDVDRAVERVIEEVSLGEHRHTRIDSLSGGQRKRVGVATELVSRPGLLFLDEPTTGLDPASRLTIWEELRRINGHGTTVFLTTQYLEEADQLCDRIAIIDSGRIVREGTPQQLKDDLRERWDGDGEPTLDDVFLDATGRTRARAAGEVQEVTA